MSLSNFAKNALRVRPELCPELDRTLSRVCARLGIERNIVELYVFPGSEISAFCYVHDSPVVVGISSGIANNFDEEELAFVLGHEIGHVFFAAISDFSPAQGCLEDQIASRAVELSVDRIGLLATTNIDSAFRAILKTLSGLQTDKLRFDFSNLMSDARESSDAIVTREMLYASHPPLPLRFRALVGFSTTDTFHQLSGSRNKPGSRLDDINLIVEGGLANSIDYHANREIDRHLADLMVWIVCFLIVHKKQIRLSEIRDVLGVELDKSEIKKGMNLIESMPSSECEVFMSERVQTALAQAVEVAPRRTRKVLSEIGGVFPDLRVVVPDHWL